MRKITAMVRYRYQIRKRNLAMGGDKVTQVLSIAKKRQKHQMNRDIDGTIEKEE